MTQQRQVSPLPPGRYWLELAAEARDEFPVWVRDMAGAVVVRTTEDDTQGDPPTLFVIFEVPEGREPFLPADRFGFPNIAAPNVKSRQDVEQAPPEPLDWNDRLQAALSNVSPTGWVVLAAVAFFALSGDGKRK